MLPGRLPKSRARSMPWAMARPRAAAALAGRKVAALRHRQGEFAQRPANFRRLAFHLIEPVYRLHGHDHRVLDPPRDLAALDLFLGKVDDRFVGTGLVQQPHRGADRATKLALAKIALLAQSHQQDAVGERPFDVVQQQRAAELSFHVAATDDFADIAAGRAVDQIRGKAGLAVVEDTDDHAGAALLLWAAAFYGKFHRRFPETKNLPFGGTNRIIGKSAQKSQNISVVMVFRRSLVRELTATAIALFLVLLGILFTNLVLRLLARAAGGTVAPEGILALLGFNALFYFNILLSVALFLTVLLTLSRWYRDSEMIVWFTSGQGLTAWLKPILWFASPFLHRDRRALALAVAVGGTAPPRVRTPARVARRAVAPGARTVQGVQAGQAGRVHRKHQFLRRNHPQYFSAFDRQREGRHHRCAFRPARRQTQRRPLYRARGRTSLRGQSGHRRFSQRGVRPPRPAESNRRRPGRCPRRSRRFLPQC